MTPGPTSPEARLAAIGELVSYYYGALIRKGQRPEMSETKVQSMILTLLACDGLGQLRIFDGGFVAWMRFKLEHLDIAFGRDLEAVLSLGREELTTGQVCFIAEVLAEKPRQAYTAMRELSRLEGVTHMAAWRNLTRRKVQKLHGR